MLQGLPREALMQPAVPRGNGWALALGVTLAPAHPLVPKAAEHQQGAEKLLQTSLSRKSSEEKVRKHHGEGCAVK